MKLASYLELKRENAAAFASRAGIDVSTVSRVINGKRRPEWSTIDKIMLATDGAVTPNDFIPETNDPPARMASAQT